MKSLFKICVINRRIGLQKSSMKMETLSNNTNGGDIPSWQWLTVGDVARAIGLTEERVRQLIRERKIRATKIGGWLVQPRDLADFVKSRTNVPLE